MGFSVKVKIAPLEILSYMSIMQRKNCNSLFIPRKDQKLVCINLILYKILVLIIAEHEVISKAQICEFEEHTLRRHPFLSCYSELQKSHCSFLNGKSRSSLLWSGHAFIIFPFSSKFKTLQRSGFLLSNIKRFSPLLEDAFRLKVK